MFEIGTKKEQTDEESMIKFQDGDAGAFDVLLHRHSAGVLRFIMKILRVSNSQAEDLLQEVFLKVIEHRKKYDSKQKFTTWLYALARNRCIDYLRVEKYRRHTSLDASLSTEEGDGYAVIDIVKSNERNQEDRAMDKEIRKMLDKGVRDLKGEYREVFLLREVEGLSLKEVADIVEAPLSTVKSRLRYAYQNLREVFIKAGHFEEGQKQRAKEVRGQI